MPSSEEEGRRQQGSGPRLHRLGRCEPGMGPSPGRGGRALTHRPGQHGVPWWSLRGLGPPEETESQLRLPRVPPGLL